MHFLLIVDAQLFPKSAKASKNSKTIKGAAGRGQASFFMQKLIYSLTSAPTDEKDEMLMIDERHGGLDEDERAWLIEAQKFMRRQQRLQYARARRDAVEEIVRADRYMRRAANQLVKALKASLKGL